MFEIKHGYENKKELSVLFEEYTNMLVQRDARVAQYLLMQNYADELAHMDTKYGLPRGRLYIAWDGEEAAGCIALRDMGEGICEMKRLYVRPKFRGMGISVKLIECIVRDAKEIGYQKMYLDTLAFLNEAINLYHKMGFREIEAYNDNPIEGSVFMELKL